jgi:hypothetical protein
LATAYFALESDHRVTTNQNQPEPTNQPKPTPKTMKLKQALMNGQDLSASEAAEVIHEMRRRVYEDGADPEEVLYEEGLEPDYIFDLI